MPLCKQYCDFSARMQWATHRTPYHIVQIYVFFLCCAKPFNNRIICTVQFRCGCVFYFQWLFRWRQKNSLEIIIIVIYKRTPKEKNMYCMAWHGKAYGVPHCLHTCTVDSSFVGFFIIDAIFIFMIRLLSQPDFYRILINFISIFMRLCRYKLWPLILILVRSFSLSLLTRNCISLCCIDNSLSHRFTSFHHKILLFNLKKKTSFCGWEHFEKVQTHVQCWRTNARGTEKRRDEEKTGVESFYFISINVHAV